MSQLSHEMLVLLLFLASVMVLGSKRKQRQAANGAQSDTMQHVMPQFVAHTLNTLIMFALVAISVKHQFMDW